MEDFLLKTAKELLDFIKTKNVRKLLIDPWTGEELQVLVDELEYATSIPRSPAQGLIERCFDQKTQQQPGKHNSPAAPTEIQKEGN